MADKRYYQEYASSGEITEIYINGRNNSNKVITVDDIVADYIPITVLDERFSSGYYTEIHSGSSHYLHLLSTKQYVQEQLLLSGEYSDSDVKDLLGNANNITNIYLEYITVATIRDISNNPQTYSDSDVISLLEEGSITSIYVQGATKLKLATEEYVNNVDNDGLTKDVAAKYISTPTYTPRSADGGKIIYMTNTGNKTITLSTSVFGENKQIAITNLSNTNINFTSTSNINGSSSDLLDAIPPYVSVYIARYNAGFIVAANTDDIPDGDVPEVTAAASTTVLLGETAQFTATVTSAVSHTQVWQYRIDSSSSWITTSQTSNTYTTSATTAEHEGRQYRLIANNEFGDGFGDPGTLSITIPNTDGIDIVDKHWTWDGDEILLLGGFNGGSPFLFEQNIGPDTSDTLTPDLDDLQAAGGNYIRNTLANYLNPQSNGKNTQDFPFIGYPKNFNLTVINQQYFDRIDALLTKAEARGIVVSMELWDPWFLIQNAGAWEADGSNGISNWWNPDNNITYGTATGLPITGASNNLAFTRAATNPTSANAVVLRAQKLFVDHVCIEMAKHNNVILQIENESPEPTAWDDFWANYVHNKGLGIPITTMRDGHYPEYWLDDNPGDAGTEKVRWALEHTPYTHADTSQKSATNQTLDTAFNEVISFNNVANKPINAIKIYSHWYQGNNRRHRAVDFFFLMLMAGNAGVAFHPGDDSLDDNGLGMSPKALRAISCGDWLANRITPSLLTPIAYNDSRWTNRNSNRVFAASYTGNYVFTFTNVDDSWFHFRLPDLIGAGTQVRVWWYDLDELRVDGRNPSAPYEELITESPTDYIEMQPPSNNSNQWVAHVTAV